MTSPARGASLVGGQQRGALGPIKGDPRRRRHALFGQRYGRGQGFRQCDRAIFSQELVPGVDGAGNGDGMNAAGRDFGQSRSLEPIGVGHRRRTARAIEARN
jgi:hypothetical protein